MPWWTLIVALLVAAFGAWWASTPPAPLPATATAAVFSAERAMGDLRAAFARPHPAGSAEARRTVAHLAGRMRRLGLEVRVQPTSAAFAKEGSIVGGDLVNIVGVLPGRDRALPALLIMAHHDTVPSSPGAGDDGFGVAGGLEIVRALKARGAPARDVILLFTDGEEMGLLGARAFFAGDPLRGRIGLVLNMDTRGDAGRAIMYETGPAPGGLVRLYARETVDPFTDSVAAFVRRGIRNSSDFAITAGAGLPGLNYAVIGDQFDYHAASSTPATIDRRSLQNYGANVLAAAAPLAFARDWPKPAAEPAYASLLGTVTIVYDHWVGWLLIAAATGVGAAALRRRPLAQGAALRGFGVALGLLLAAALAVHLLRLATGVPYGFTAVRPLLARFGLFESAVAAIGGALAVAALVGRRRGVGDRSVGLFAAVLLLAITAQALAPPTAVLATWTLLAGGIVLLLATWAGTAAALTAALVAGLATGQVLATGHLILLTVGENMPEATAPFVLLAALPLAPLMRGQAWLRPAGLLLAAIALAGALVIRLAPIGSAARPRPSQILYVSDADGRSWRASSLPAIDPWTDAMLRSDGAKGWERRPLPPLFVGRDYVRGVAMAPARPARVDEPDIMIVGDGQPGSGADQLIVAAPPGTRQVNLRLALPAGVGARVNGSTAVAPRAGEPLDIRWVAPRRPVSVTIDRPGRVTGLVSVLRDGRPARARPPAPRSPDTMPWYNDGATLVIRRIDTRR